MKLFVISDNTDTLVGMRLAGIDGVRVRTQKEACTALERAAEDASIGMIFITEQAAGLCTADVDKISKRTSPLLVTIPGPDGAAENSRISAYIEEAIGIQL